jgi:hypothetical protein
MKEDVESAAGQRQNLIIFFPLISKFELLILKETKKKKKNENLSFIFPLCLLVRPVLRDPFA